MAILTEDWVDKLSPSGLGDEWRLIPGQFASYSIYSPIVVGFRDRVQKITRQASKTGDIGVVSNDFAIVEARNNYQVEFWYRSNASLFLYRLNGTSLVNPGGGFVAAEYSASPTNAVNVIETVVGNSLPFNGIVFYLNTDKFSGPTIWFEIDRVSCREII
jgi:hypothetical protein